MMFPALWIAREGSFGVIDEPMERASVAAFRNGFFEGLRFFDASGTEWRVESAVPKRRPGILDTLFNRTLTVDLQIGVQRNPAVAAVAQDLCFCVDRDPDDLYDQFVSHIELKELFRAAASASELIELARTLGEASEDRASGSDG